MEFGYFTLSDNHYEHNQRSANQFVAAITAEALLADALGMHSAWIGEHHFNSLGVLSCPDLVLAYIAARTQHSAWFGIGVGAPATQFASSVIPVFARMMAPASRRFVTRVAS